MCKSTKILSEIDAFFQKNEDEQKKVLISDMIRYIENINISNDMLGKDKRFNCSTTNEQLFHLHMLLPFLNVDGISHYCESSMQSLINCKKDTLYSFVNKDDIKWRSILYDIAKKLIKQTCSCDDNNNHELPKVLVADDTDLIKTSKQMEHIGYVYSHTEHRGVLGYKMLSLGYFDGKSFIPFDISMHCEMCKDKEKIQGLTEKQIEARFSRERDGRTYIGKLEKGLFASKIADLVTMINRANNNGIPFEYVLADRWFICSELVNLAYEKGFHLLGKIKRAGTNYELSNGENLQANEIYENLKKSKAFKFDKKIGCYYATVNAKLKGKNIKLLFSHEAKDKNKWEVILTTNTSLNFRKAYKIEVMRWSTEVYYRDAKELLGLGKCSSRDFSAQVSHTYLTTIRYAIMSIIKRFHHFETIGGVVRETCICLKDVTMFDKIWQYILECAQIISINFKIDINEMILHLIETSYKFMFYEKLSNNLVRCKKRKQT